jgi:hypothetical protein
VNPGAPAGARRPATRLRRLLVEHDVWAGLLFVAFGCVALLLGRDLEVGAAAEMGEGYVPRAMAIALLALGTLVIVLAWLRGPGEPGSQIEALRWRPLLFVTVAILAFAAALEPLGLVAAIGASVVAANFAGQPLALRPLALLTVVLCLGVLAVFVWGLGLPLYALPRLGG